MANNNKKTLYIGGLAEEVDLETLRTAFLPFGDITDVSLPIDYSTQKHKGFAFIEYLSPGDAADAIDNMDNGEILGKTIRVNTAKPMRFKESNNKPIWADEEYLRKVEEERNETKELEENQLDVEIKETSDESS